MKQVDGTLTYKLKGEISEKDEVNGVITVVKGKNTDDLNIGDFIEDAQNWFAERTEGDEVEVTFVAKLIQK